MSVFSRWAKYTHRTLVLVALGCGIAATGFAGTAERGARMAGDVQVLSGGVGEGARKALAAQARGHNVKLVFTLSTGHYLSEVPFQIQRGGKVVVEHVADGPWAFAKLAPGTYTITASYEGKTQKKQVSVGASGQKRVNFVWPAPQRVKEQPG